MVTSPFFRNLFIVAILAFTLAACDLMKPHEVRQGNAKVELIHHVVQTPMLIGGMDGLYDKVQYPDEVRDDGIEGRVVLHFRVNEKGHPQDVEVLQSVHPLLDREAVRVVCQTRWTTENTPITMSLPINFQLREAQ